MDDLNKKSQDEKEDFLREPVANYEINFTEKLDSTNTDGQEALLQKLLALGLKQSELGIGISNDEMKRRTKLKYPFLK